ncbi:MAG: 4Fe-4S dicluster domain-containing protein [Thermoplasmata archaeon]|nr:4Fe-4S dicluster domain-containing protein [Thermoplasmata archaeon]
MNEERRRFIKFVGLGAAGVGIGLLGFSNLSKLLTSAAALGPNDLKMRKWGMVIDLGKCTGCGACTEACQAAHFIPFNQEWIKIYELHDNPLAPSYHFPRPCMHCEDPPCRNVCPVGATFRRDDGVVLIDHRICIGCRYCMVACPYSARYFNWGDPPHTPEELAHDYSPEEPWPHQRGVVEKCDFCVTHGEKGMLPACVIGCPSGAVYYGDLAEDAVSNGKEILRVSEVMRVRQGYRFKEELGTHPRVYYLPRG